MYLKNYINNIGEVKNKDTNTIISDSTKGTMVGATIGAGVGLFIGFAKKKNLLMCTFLGAFTGGVIGRFVKKSK